MSRPTYTRHFTDDEAQRLLDAYGGDSINWPSEIRDALLKTINGSTRLRAAQQTALRLDQLFTKHRDLEANVQDERTAQLAAKIMRELPPQNPAKSTAAVKILPLRFTLPHLTAWWPAPAIAAALVALFIVALLPSEQTLPNSAELAFEQWAWEDITAQNLVPENGAEFDEDFETLIGLQQDG